MNLERSYHNVGEAYLILEKSQEALVYLNNALKIVDQATNKIYL